MADVDLGLAQDMSDTAFRIDAENFLFEVPAKDKLDAFSAGATIPTTFWETYGLATLNFAEEDSSGKLKYDEMTLGVGYPIEFGDFTLRGELRASSPNWTKFKEWTWTPMLSLQFSFDSLLPQ